ncbi:glycosyltransferase family 4 protein [Lentibacillus cibarius]|uniref:Undecaprenyl/decaprenyl-phosphate alpha-N-acetylglucosaminyl 1-phosphate transferase n=1 Tax=Lentibacillus cibarius TaxID=2583219 RepID=A0A5S3QJ69_9BACI|nr:MraY family glycosyltransferase [Lentibacillus cibarius]TMN21769.1 undecaprenyl/decaprenyl-phosphate alpha-N-acetylglucosaminyl 1-phosphate transferase [Lentibacillus cibarius]
MMNVIVLVAAFVVSLAVSFFSTPLVKRLAISLGAVDKPDQQRKTHKGIKTSMGGLAILIGAVAGLLIIRPEHPQLAAILLGGVIMMATGMLDDLLELKPIMKLLGQVLAAITVVASGLLIDKITLPFFGIIYFGDMNSVVITIIWILAVTNAINLIDGLDGLAAGVSTIALISIFIMAIADERLIVVYLTLVLIGSCIGFLFHNFYPATIFMGDTGALFLGYAIAVVSILGLFKNIAFFSFIIPIVVIAVPMFDTIFAIVRRLMNKQSIGMADKGHIHYRLMAMGYSHRTSVLIIYGFSIFFGIMAIVFNGATLKASVLILGAVLLGIQIIAELAGVVKKGQQPLLNSIRSLLTK